MHLGRLSRKNAKHLLKVINMKLNPNSIEGRNELAKMAEWKKFLADRYWLNCSLEECAEFYIQIRAFREDVA